MFAAVQSDLMACDDKAVTVLLMVDTHAALDVHPEIFFDAEGNAAIRRAGGYALLASAISKERTAAPEGSFWSMLVTLFTVPPWPTGRKAEPSFPSAPRSASTYSCPRGRA